MARSWTAKKQLQSLGGFLFVGILVLAYLLFGSEGLQNIFMNFQDPPKTAIAAAPRSIPVSSPDSVVSSSSSSSSSTTSSSTTSSSIPSSQGSSSASIPSSVGSTTSSSFTPTSVSSSPTTSVGSTTSSSSSPTTPPIITSTPTRTYTPPPSSPSPTPTPTNTTPPPSPPPSGFGTPYPGGHISITKGTTTPLEINGTVPLIIDFAYTTSAQEFPLASLEVEVNLPLEFTYVPGINSAELDGDIIDIAASDHQIIFHFKIEPSSNITDAQLRTYSGKITLNPKVTNLPNSAITVQAKMSCYALDAVQGNMNGAVSCSSSPSPDNAVQMDDVAVSWEVGDPFTTANNEFTIESDSAVDLNTSVYCGNGTLEGSESCDDGNARSDDGCDTNCRIMDGWRCTDSAPSQCGTVDCLSHGERFDSSNIFGVCCAGLETLNFPRDTMILASGGTDMVTVCFDPQIDIPQCFSDRLPPGRWMKKTPEGDSRLIFAGSCDYKYKDYSQILLTILQQEKNFCAFGDDAYSSVDFNDLTNTKQRSAIEALEAFCIVKGRGEDYEEFVPQKNITRAEFIKILIKLMLLNDGQDKALTIQPEAVPYPLETPFLDVASTHRAAQYIVMAYQAGILRPLTYESRVGSFFRPGKALKRSELIDVLRLVPQGQFLTKDTMENVVGEDPYVTRAEASEVLVKKFLPLFRPYFYFQGDQQEYYWQLVDLLKGKTYEEQYTYLLHQVEQLGEVKNSTPWKMKKLDPWWMRTFLQYLLSQN